MATYRQKLQEFQAVFEADAIDLKQLRKLALGGCPSEKSYRSKSWKVLLDYLPLKTAEWKEFSQKQRQTYKQFIDEMILQPGSKQYDSSRTDVTFEDHPLNPNPDSQWKQYFKDNDMLLQIDKDCRRLYPDLAFFQSATQYPCKELVQADTGIQTLRKRVEHTVLRAQDVSQTWQGITKTNVRRSRAKTNDFVVLSEGQEAHWEVAERILFIYSKLNPGQGYVQGMNEIIGPIYYTFASDLDPAVKEHAEADSFWCFTNLMSEIRDFFIKTLDDSQCGIGMSMNKLMELLKQKDSRVFRVLQDQDLKPQYFAFRWITLLLSQEFTLPDVLRVWDALLSDAKRFEFLIYVCCAMIILVRQQIVTGDFTTNMKLIQNYPVSDVNIILSKADEMYPR